MASHRAQAQFQRAKWRLLLLAPAWSLQLTLAFGMLGLFSWRLGDTIHHFEARDKAGKAPVIEYVWEATNVALSSVVALCTIFEIARYFSESLTPWTMLFTHVVKLACASAILALDVVIYVQRSDARYSLVGLGMDALLLVIAISLAIYAIMAYRRLSKYDDYSHPVNVKPYGFNDGLDGDTSYSSFSSRTGLRTSMDKRGSLGSERLSIGSLGRSLSNPTLIPPVEQRPRRYSHERDTQFDEYMVRKTSGGYKFDSSSPPSDTPLGDSLTAIGAIHSRSRGSSVSQTMSYTSDHVLVSVPEEEGEMVEVPKDLKRDHETLLVHDSRK
ncbi:hypothetical protein A0O28_0057720 [Trichoderma guizhouense]|uniref:Uncharacterized protein n=1 Tax=Trichoderma guizhouense TaxID=1491466 RepID=A0A1T3C6G9_9HYPO|nr:hypothetical protein A0O28_0057720 [Trichoderma guizhouense]